ncbi:MAG: efflux RND transporter permease subunit [Planctomycetota bacterium]|nr:efflux RND transporter permease subunit [Planctomycetota bacterium]MDA0932038.1 efflux RND transporter permease subunit [Planctomycetota bacterium]MDA1221063.1 efflux RND transporter permease subunit [Planctomycetota bacterium]
MLNQIIRAALGNRLIVLVTALTVAVFGTLAVLRSPIDVLPDLDRPVVTILTDAPGLVAEDVEQLVTWPIEQVLNGATGIFRVRSSSAPGLSAVYAEFDWDADIYRARQIVSEKLQLADVPPGVTPVMAPVSSIMGQVLLVGYRSKDGSTPQQELRRIVDRDVRTRLLALPGVAQVVTTGSRPTELQVIADADRMRAFDVTLPEVRSAVEKANRAAFGGTLEQGVKGPYVGVSGRLRAAEELAEALVHEDAVRPVRLSDVAEVTFGPSRIGTGDAGVDGGPGVLVVVTKQPGIDTVELTERIESELDALQAQLPQDIERVDGLFRQADFIHRAIENVTGAVRDGAILVVLVLFLFLMNLRTTWITLTAIPLSVAIAAMVFSAFGLSLNTMTLGGLAVAIGTLVDDAIVDVENVYRRLFENRQRTRPRDALHVVYEASCEVRKPVTYGTLLVTVVYLPLFFLTGIEGRLFLPIGLAYIVSVTASLLVALTVTPVLCLLLLGSTKQSSQALDHAEYGGRVVEGLRRAADGLARLSIARPAPILGVALSLFLGAALILALRGTTFLPPFNEGSAQVNIMLPPDTSLATSDRFGRRLEDVLLEVEGVAHVARRTGRAEGDEHIMPVSTTEAIVSFDPESSRSRDEILEEIRHEVAEAFPGLANETEQPLAHLLSHMLSGVTAQVAIKLTGPDLRVLREIAAEVEEAIHGIPGVRDLYVEPLIEVDQVEVSPRRADMARLNVTVDDIASTVALAMGTEEVSRLREGRVSYPIKVGLRSEDRADLQDLGGLLVRSRAGELVRLGDVAEVRMTKTPNEVRRENVERRLVVRHNVAERPLGDVVADVERALEPVRAELADLPGYGIRLSGQFEAQQEASRIIVSLSVLSLAAMVLILYLHFRSLLLAHLVLLSRPIAFVGAVIAIMWTGQAVSIASMVGMIALLGMATRNAILLVDHAVELMREQGRGFSEDLLVLAARERIVPVMMTALTSGIGLVPLALAADEPGREILYPVATVILGGLVTNTLLDFVVTPGLLSWFARDELDAMARPGVEESV